MFIARLSFSLPRNAGPEGEMRNKCWVSFLWQERMLFAFYVVEKRISQMGQGISLFCLDPPLAKGIPYTSHFSRQRESLCLGLKTLQRIVDILFNWSFLQPSIRRALTLSVHQWRGSTIWEAMSPVCMIWDPASMLVIWAWARLFYGMLPKLSGPRCLHLSRRENHLCAFSRAAGEAKIPSQVLRT